MIDRFGPRDPRLSDLARHCREILDGLERRSGDGA
jgi:hypothetical protein